MKRSIKPILFATVLLVLALTACGGKGTVVPTPDLNLFYTQAWQTVQAGQTQTAAAVPPTETPTEAILNTPTEKLTNTPLLTDTPLVAENAPSATPLVIVSPKPTALGVCDNAAYVTDVTYPDGTEVAPNTQIVKTWRFKNLGPCTWDQDYRLVYSYQSDGANWQNTKAVPFPAIILPGDTMDISVTLTTPGTAGGYAAWFSLQNDKGINFYLNFAIYVKVVK